jgi:hypothetical protein
MKHERGTQKCTRNIYFLRGPVTTAYLHSCMWYTLVVLEFIPIVRYGLAQVYGVLFDVVPVPTDVLVIPVPSRSPSLLQVPCKIR